jgi:hypothetical protein
MPWIEPIYDRIQSDIDNKTPKAYINVDDLNRIEGNIKYLTDILKSYGYEADTVSKAWNINGLPTIADVQRILDNTQNLINIYYQFSNTPPVPNDMVYYTNVNSLEFNLYQLNNVIETMLKSFKKSNKIKCGQSIYL